MSPDPTSAESEASRRRPTSPTGPVVPWAISADASGYPQRLASCEVRDRWAMLYGLGTREILQRRCLGLICSVRCPGSVVLQTFDAIRELRDAGVIVAGGFHSPMEQQCLEFLLRGKQPVIVCPARHPTPYRLPEGWLAALVDGRLLIVSPFDSEAKRTNRTRAQVRNRFVAALSAGVFIPHASHGGATESLALQICKTGQPLWTLESPENSALLSLGATPLNIAEVARSLLDGQ